MTAATTGAKLRAALSFTGGKDCMLALAETRTNPTYQDVEIVLLVTFGPPEAFEDETVAGAEIKSEDPEKDEGVRREKKKGFKAHPLPVIRAQARALALPHATVPIVAQDGHYLESYQAAIEGLMAAHRLTHLVTGDILDVCAGFMAKAAAASGCTLVRPLWQLPRKVLLDKMAGFTFLLSCCSVNLLGEDKARRLVGMWGPAAYQELCRVADRNAALPRGDEDEGVEMDACGEKGEYHSMVLDMPFFVGHRLTLGEGEEGRKPPILTSEDGNYVYCDLAAVRLVAK